MKVKLKKFEYVSDWFDIKDVEIDTDDFAFFVLQYRLGSWFLMHYIVEDGKAKNDYINDFELYNPAMAVKELGEKIKRYESLHSENITEPLFILIDKVKRMKMESI